MAKATTPSLAERNNWYKQVYSCGKSVKETCEIFGISRKKYYKWHNRDHGSKRSYRNRLPHPNCKLTNEIKYFITKTKRRTNYGPAKMKIAVKRQFGVDVSTTVIYRYYKRKKLIRKPQRKQPWYEPLKEPLLIEKQGQGVQLDTKYVYHHGVRMYQFSVLDPYTKMHYHIIRSTKHSYHAVDALKESQAYFGFTIESVQTDNGSEYRGDFHTWCTKNNLPHYFIPKKSPYWNGHVERVHRTIDEEYYHNPYREWTTRIEWLRYYNHERIHLSLNGLTPYEFLTQKCNP